MKALYLRSGQLSLEDQDPPKIESESLLQVELAGVCDTDLQLKRGYMGFEGIPGHEFVARVVESPDPKWLGQRVVGEINAACAQCSWCRRGLDRHCPHRTVLGILGRHGAHAELLSLPLRNLQAVPESISPEEAVFAEPLAAACEILEQVSIKPQDKVAVIGDGKLGLLIAQVLALTGCELLVVGRHASKLGILDRRGIETECVAPGEASKRPQAWADLTVDCTGSPSGFQEARRLVRPRGTIILKTTIKDKIDIDLASIVIDEITLIGSRCGPFDAALRLLERKLVDVSALIADEFPLSQGIKAYERAGQRGTLKVLIRP